MLRDCKTRKYNIDAFLMKRNLNEIGKLSNDVMLLLFSNMSSVLIARGARSPRPETSGLSGTVYNKSVPAKYNYYWGLDIPDAGLRFLSVIARFSDFLFVHVLSLHFMFTRKVSSSYDWMPTFPSPSGSLFYVDIIGMMPYFLL
jgi:hypothetical protein